MNFKDKLLSVTDWVRLKWSKLVVLVKLVPWDKVAAFLVSSGIASKVSDKINKKP